MSKIEPVVNQDLGYLLKRASSLVTANLATALSSENLRVTEATVLREISAFPLITASEIGRLLNIKRANMTPLVTLLVERNYVELEAKDGRSQGLKLTSVGEEVAERVQQIFREHETKSFSAINNDEQQQLRDMLLTILKK